MTYCAKVLDDSTESQPNPEGLACGEEATEIVTVEDNVLHLKYDVDVCPKHAAEFRQRAAASRAAARRRKRKTSNFNG